MLRNIGVLPRAAFNAITFKCGPLSRSMTSDSKSQLLSHFRAQRLPFSLRIFLAVPTELQDCHENRECQATKQHHKHSANILHTQCIRLRLLILLVSTANLARVLPPLVVKYLNGSFFLQLKNCERNFISPYASLGSSDSISLSVIEVMRWNEWG